MRVGDTTNLAARLQDIAKPGEIVVGPLTAESLGGSFELAVARQRPEQRQARPPARPPYQPLALLGPNPLVGSGSFPTGDSDTLQS